MSVTSFQSGAYTGATYNPWGWQSSQREQLASVEQWLEDGQDIASLGRHALVYRTMTIGADEVPVAIKSFSRGSWMKDRYFARHGSKARRSFDTAVRLVGRSVGTPIPIAYLDRWENGRLTASFYLCRYETGITSFREELDRLYSEDPLCRRIMTLMETVAFAIADMHDAGVCHRDLGNQNILLRRDGEDAWKDVAFIDLNRAHLADTLTVQQRARDLSRIDLPSDFFRVFKCMYFRHQHPSDAFNQWEAHYRKRFAFHTASRANSGCGLWAAPCPCAPPTPSACATPRWCLRQMAAAWPATTRSTSSGLTTGASSFMKAA